MPNPSAYRGRLLELPPNRVWRTYLGGRTLDTLAGAPEPADNHFPEDWIGSLTRARNPGRDDPDEGLSRVSLNGEDIPLADLIAADPAYFLGAETKADHPGVLVKLLDPAIRLHFQVHPTAAFARSRLDSPSGKAEAYHILGLRPETKDPHVYIGFRKPVSTDELRHWITEQNLPAIKDALHRVPVRVGDTLFVPGGCPHALGAGLLLVEIQEPSDWVVRFEFERGGYTLPESSRFMDRGIDFALEVFDRNVLEPDALRAAVAPAPRVLRQEKGSLLREELIGPSTTPCFRLHRTRYNAPGTHKNDGFHIGILIEGQLDLRVGGHLHRLRPFDKYLLPAGLPSYEALPGPTGATVLECRGPA